MTRAEIEALLDRMGSSDESERAAARREFESIGAPAISALVNRWSVLNVSQETPAFARGMAVPATLYVVGIAYAGAARWSAAMGAAAAAAAGLVTWRVLSPMRGQSAASKEISDARLQMAEATLESLTGVEWAPALLGRAFIVLNESQNDVKTPVPPAIRALSHSLPLIDERTARQLTPAQMANVRRLLNVFYTLLYPDAVIGALRVARLREDPTECLAAVRYLAESPVSSANGMRVRESARECETALRARAGREAEAGLLLRAAENPTHPEETLLRPAAHSASENTAALLHPADGPAGP